MISDLTRMIEQVSREKGVERDVLISALEEAVKAAARKKFGPDYDLEVSYNEELGEIEVFEFKEVVEKVTDEHIHVSFHVQDVQQVVHLRDVHEDGHLCFNHVLRLRRH